MGDPQSVSYVPATTLTIGTVSGQDLTVLVRNAPASVAKDLLAATRPVALVTTDAREVWVRPEHIETVSYTALEEQP